MKLCGEHVVAPNGGSECLAVLRSRRDDGFVSGLREKAVDEINVAAVCHVAEQGTLPVCHFELIPADLRNLQPVLFSEAHDAAFENAEACSATVEFLTPFEQCLVADADSEKRFAGLDELTGGFKQFLFTQRVDAIVEGAYAGQNHASRVADFLRPLNDAHLRSDFQQCLVNAAQVAGSVI